MNADFILTLFAPSSSVWPLVVLLIALFVLRKVETEMKPIVTSVVSGVAKNAQGNAMVYAMALFMAAAASMQALANVAYDRGWGYVAAAANVMQPGLVAIIAYFTKSPLQAKTEATNPPFTQPPVP